MDNHYTGQAPEKDQTKLFSLIGGILFFLAGVLNFIARVCAGVYGFWGWFSLILVTLSYFAMGATLVLPDIKMGMMLGVGAVAVQLLLTIVGLISMIVSSIRYSYFNFWTLLGNIIGSVLGLLPWALFVALLYFRKKSPKKLKSLWFLGGAIEGAILVLDVIIGLTRHFFAFLPFLAVLVDVGALILGGYAIYKEYMESGEAEETAAQPNSGYAPNGGYQPNPGYNPNGGYQSNPNFNANSSPNFNSNPNYQGNPGYNSNPGFQQPMGSAPIKNRSIAVCIILTIVTCGIYGIVWMIQVVNDLNVACGEPQDTSGGVVWLLSIVTCNIYLWVWLYKAGKKVDRMTNAMNSSNSLIYLLLGIFGFSIVSFALIQNELNKVAAYH